MAENDTIAVTAQCLCKTHTFTTNVTQSSLPLPASCCHCTSCRRVSGAMYTSCTAWPNPSENLSALKQYTFGTNTVFSCATCSTPLFCKGPNTGNVPWVATGALHNTPGLVDYKIHIFVGDTVDGGAAVWLPHHTHDGQPAKRLREGRGSETLSATWPGRPELSAKGLGAGPAPERTRFRCHCNGVDFSLRSGRDLRDAPKQDLQRWFVHTQTLKYTGSLECCDSCRSAFGSDLIGWSFAPLSHVEFAGGDDAFGAAEFPRTVAALREAVDSADKDARLGTLAYYQSSPDVERYFCSTCSASVFYAVHDRTDMVDIAVGLLDHPDGARAEGLLSWRLDKVGWAADAAGGWREELATTAHELQQEYAEATGRSKGAPA